MPRKPNATRPNANTAGASMIPEGNEVLTIKPRPISVRIASPNQYALKLPATKPDKMLSEAPPSREAVTISRTCRDEVDVNTFTNSGITAPASVPQVTMVDSFHHNDVSPARSGIRILESTDVRT